VEGLLLGLYFFIYLVYRQGVLVTDTSNKVVVVKVHRSTAGAKIPFDKLYFFPKAKTDTIPTLFGYALVFPCEPTLMQEIVKLRPRILSAYRHRRDDALLAQRIDLDGRKDTPDTVADWWKTNILTPYDLTERVVVVPILTSKIRKKINPRYLSAPKWFNKEHSPTKSRRTKSRRRSLPVTDNAHAPQAISDFAYLATPLPAPNDKISPICNICPRQMLQLQGACTPGQAICLKSLNFNEIGKDRPLDMGPDPEDASETEVEPEDGTGVPF
jgi:hypothetical protein